MTKLSMIHKSFEREIRLPEAQISLERAALYLALIEYPLLNIDSYIDLLDSMAAEVKPFVTPDTPPFETIEILNSYFFGVWGFSSTVFHHHNPANNYLNEVIDRRIGNALTLALVYQAIAQRVGFPLVGIGLPGHFLLRPDLPGCNCFIDPLHGGAVLTRQDCHGRLMEIFGRSVELKPEYLQPFRPHHFLARLLTNLKLAYLNRGEIQKALFAVEQILRMFPDHAEVMRDRMVLNYQLHRLKDAQRDLELYRRLAPEAEDTEGWQEMLTAIDTNRSVSVNRDCSALEFHPKSPERPADAAVELIQLPMVPPLRSNL